MGDENPNTIPNQNQLQNQNLNVFNPADPLLLSPSDDPNMQLTTGLFNGHNFANWSRGVRMAVGAKNKLGFIDGTCKKPSVTEVNRFQQWMRCDNMIRCWLLNSMVSNVAAGFMFVNSGKEMWDEMVERYGQANGPLLYQLKKELVNTTQNNLPMAEYYIKLWVLWDEIEDIEGFPECNCGALNNCTCNILRALLNAQARNKTIQFLMGVNDGYDNLRGNLLAMEPMLPVNKTFSYMLQAKQQKHVSGMLNMEASALTAKRQIYTQNQKFQAQGEQYAKKGKYDKEEREKLYCTKCKKNGHIAENCSSCTECDKHGHTIETCFEIHGYPDWWKGPRKMKSGANNKYLANVTEGKRGDLKIYDNPLEMTGNNGYETGNGAREKVDSGFVTAVAQEL